MVSDDDGGIRTFKLTAHGPASVPQCTSTIWADFEMGFTVEGEYLSLSFSQATSLVRSNGRWSGVLSGGSFKNFGFNEDACRELSGGQATAYAGVAHTLRVTKFAEHWSMPTGPNAPASFVLFMRR